MSMPIQKAKFSIGDIVKNKHLEFRVVILSSKLFFWVQFHIWLFNFSSFSHFSSSLASLTVPSSHVAASGFRKILQSCLSEWGMRRDTFFFVCQLSTISDRITSFLPKVNRSTRTCHIRTMHRRWKEVRHALFVLYFDL